MDPRLADILGQLPLQPALCVGAGKGHPLVVGAKGPTALVKRLIMSEQVAYHAFLSTRFGRAWWAFDR